MGPTPPPQKPEPPKPDPASDQDRKTRKEIPLVSVPNDRDMLADEMAELFEEDQVTHKHGNVEPESD